MNSPIDLTRVTLSNWHAPFNLAVFGPNGSGKTSIERLIGVGDAQLMKQVKHGRAFIDEQTGKLGILYVNADSIARQMLSEDPCANIDETNRIAQKRAEEIRRYLAKNKADFAWESVASHPSKVEFLKELHDIGYFNVILVVSTEDPSINNHRVRHRARFGGHDVPPDKVKSRYYRMSALIPEYYELADVFIAYDNSRDAHSSDEESARLLIVKDANGMTLYPACNDVRWIHTYLLDSLR